MSAGGVDVVVLEHRMDMLEASVAGCPAGNTELLMHRIKTLQEKINQIEASVPNMKVNREIGWFTDMCQMFMCYAMC
jgi:hypothetical protein